MLLLIFLSFGCVESITDTQTSSTPSIDVYSPATGDTVKVGKTVINYQADDAANGTGLSFYELYVNKLFVRKISQSTDNTNPTLYLEIDSTLLHTRISYSVKVYNKLGKTKESKLQENIFVKDKLPNAPTNLLLSRLNDFAVTLKWDDNSKNEFGFELWRKDINNGVTIDYRKIKTLPPNTISTTDGSLSPYGDYLYKVKAFNESGSSEFSNEITTSSLPNGPWNLQAEATGSSLVRLTWIDFVTNEQGFQIERTEPSTNTYKVLAIVAPNATEYYDNTVTASTAYKYRVAYFTQNTISAYSNEASVSTFFTDVSPPSNLSAALFSGPVLELSWTDNSKDFSKGTIVERRTGINGEFIEIGSVSFNQNKFKDPTVQSGITYYYRVRQILDKKIFTPYSTVLKVDIP